MVSFRRSLHTEYHFNELCKNIHLQVEFGDRRNLESLEEFKLAFPGGSRDYQHSYIVCSKHLLCSVLCTVSVCCNVMIPHVAARTASRCQRRYSTRQGSECSTAWTNRESCSVRSMNIHINNDTQ